MFGDNHGFRFIEATMDTPDPIKYLIVTHHEGIGRGIADYLDIPKDWEYILDSRQLRGRKPPKTRLIVDTWWLYKAPWSHMEDDKAEAILVWRARFHRTIRLVNSDLIHKGPPRDILQESKVPHGVAWQYEPSQDWTVLNSRSLFSGSQVHFSEDSRGDLQRCFTYDGKDVSRLVQRAESHRLLEPRRRVSHEDHTGSKATMQPELATAPPRYWFSVDCGGRGRKKK